LCAASCVSGDDSTTPKDAQSDTTTTSDAAFDAPAQSDVTSDVNDGGTCTADISKDSKNCGRCGHDCLAGQCVTGVCQPYLIWNDPQFPYSGEITADGTSVFWATGNPQGRVYGCGRLGCGADASVYAQDIYDTSGVAVDTANVYFTSGADGGLWSCPRGGCTAPSFLSPPGGYHLVHDGTDLYWLINGGDIRHCNTPTCSSASNLGVSTNGFGIDATNVYYTTQTDLRACTRTSCTTTQHSLLATPFAATVLGSAIATQGTQVFALLGVGDGQSSIISCPTTALSNCTPTIIAQNIDRGMGVVTDASYVYFTTWGSSNGGYKDGTVARCPLAGCPNAKPEVLVANAAGAGGLAIDNDALYYTSIYGAGPVYGLAKP
jgi:hypothetical protein